LERSAAGTGYDFWMKEKGVVMVEQPMPKTELDPIAWLTGESPLPILPMNRCSGSPMWSV